MYWLKKYNNYMGTIKRIGEEYKREYVHRLRLEKQNAKLQNDIKIIKGSRSYRLGWFMLTIPRKIKALFKGNK